MYGEGFYQPPITQSRIEGLVNIAKFSLDTQHPWKMRAMESLDGQSSQP